MFLTANGILKQVDITPCADDAMIYCNLISPQFVGRPLYADVPHRFLSASRVPKRPLCAGGAAAISVYTGLVPHVRGAARPLRG
jgi:hypothetical protein